MNDLQLVERGGEWLLESTVAAEALGIAHKSLTDTIRKYTVKIERLGGLAVETRVPETPTGNPYFRR